VKCPKCGREHNRLVFDEDLVMGYFLCEFCQHDVQEVIDEWVEEFEPFDEPDETILKRLKCQIWGTFQHLGFEDGYVHDSEGIILSNFKKHPELIKKWISEMFSYDSDTIIAIFRTLTTFDYMEDIKEFKKSPSIVALGIEGLSHEDVGVREGLLSFFADWDDPSIIPVLENMKESRVWLIQYRDAVVDELKKKHGV